MPQTLPLPYPLFPAGGAEQFLDELIRRQAKTPVAETPEEQGRAWRSLTVLAGRSRAALALWALPSMPRSALASRLGFPNGAHPFRIDAHLVELERLGRLPDIQAVNQWRDTLGRAAAGGWVAAEVSREGNNLLALLRAYASIPPVLPPDLLAEMMTTQCSREEHLSRVNWVGSALNTMVMTAARLKHEGLGSVDGPATPRECILDAKRVVVAAFEAHELGEPVPGGELTRSDLMMLATHPEGAVRQMGIMLGATVKTTRTVRPR